MRINKYVLDKKACLTCEHFGSTLTPTCNPIINGCLSYRKQEIVNTSRHVAKLIIWVIAIMVLLGFCGWALGYAWDLFSRIIAG